MLLYLSIFMSNSDSVSDHSDKWEQHSFFSYVDKKIHTVVVNVFMTKKAVPLKGRKQLKTQNSRSWWVSKVQLFFDKSTNWYDSIPCFHMRIKKLLNEFLRMK